jgi:CitMHS family citrate-Mg2+:H+ or citrate-Ca2+:H+ symporter
MLVVLGFAMIAVFMVLIMTKKLTPVLALIIVPTIFGLFAGAGLGLGDMVLDSMKSMTSTAALLMFAIIYFGLMIDVGLFDPLVKLILRKLGNDPAKVVLGTAARRCRLARRRRLHDLHPHHRRHAAGVPAPGPEPGRPDLRRRPRERHDEHPPVGRSDRPRRDRAQDRRQRRLRPDDPLAPRRPRPRHALRLAPRPARAPDANGAGGSGLGSGPLGGKRTTPGGGVALLDSPVLVAAEEEARDTALAGTALDPNRATLRPKLFWFNLALTVGIMGLLIADILPLPYVFMVGAGVALVVNFPRVKDQAAQLVAHAPSIVAVVSMVMAASVLTGVLTGEINGTTIVQEMSGWLVSIIPAEAGPFMAVITGVLSIPMTFFMSNDAFYFGVLPILSETAAHYGIPAADMARASITGQPFHMQSPLVPAILLLVSLSKVELGDHHKLVLWRSAAISLAMLAVGVVLGVIAIG